MPGEIPVRLGLDWSGLVYKKGLLRYLCLLLPPSSLLLLLLAASTSGRRSQGGYWASLCNAETCRPPLSLDKVHGNTYSSPCLPPPHPQTANIHMQRRCFLGSRAKRGDLGSDWSCTLIHHLDKSCSDTSYCVHVHAHHTIFCLLARHTHNASS